MTEAPVDVDVPTVLTSVGVFAAPVCLWAVHFGGGEDVFTTATDPLRSVRFGVNSAYPALASAFD
ncbi:hypothetical protein ACFQMH_09860 [Streptomyces viridiviolaceus]|uniref:Uncharacterized protein n=1 Tax=Streptomyces viridiviolaceus TaxID=68282 RepID=A0ABW2DZ34_9ACTN|nr:hypothetical protein [Streptomyces viridiviolaceus]